MELETALARHLNTLGIVDYREDDTGGNAFVGHMPPSPDIAVSFVATSPVPTSNEDGWDEPGVQIRVRGEAYQYSASKALATAIYEALVGLYHVTLNPGGDAEVYVVRLLFLQSGPVDIGRDENERHEWTLNLTCLCRNQTINRK